MLPCDTPPPAFTQPWISTQDKAQPQPNSWYCYRGTLNVKQAGDPVAAWIATDTRYWLWINGELVVYEGGLKRGPTPEATYVDRVDLGPHVKAGLNTITVLVWYWGGNGFSHNSSGSSGLFFQVEGRATLGEWKAQRHPGYVESQLPRPNFRLSEPHIAFDARRDLPAWQSPGFDDSSWPKPIALAAPPHAPWGPLVPRPIPLFKDAGVIRLNAREETPGRWVAPLPGNGQYSPLLTLRCGTGGQRVVIKTDTFFLGVLSPEDRLYTLGSEYVTREGRQTYESLCWLSGHELVLEVPAGVEVEEVACRVTTYNSDVVGEFICEDPLVNGLWKKAIRSLRVNMRDHFMDCPDRERAQWAGDAAMEMGQCFYALDRRSWSLARKLYRELAGWQMPSGVIYNPVPEADWKKELPAHSLMPLTELWRYYVHTRDRETVAYVYAAMMRYLDLWQQRPDGSLEYRPGGWDWGDWGENQDYLLIQHGWYLLCTQTASRIARLLGDDEGAVKLASRAEAVTRYLQTPACWTGDAFRSESHKGETDDRANALMVIAGVAGREKWEALARVFEKEFHASPWMEKFVLEALIQIDRGDLAMERMRSRYRGMVEGRWSTLWEQWFRDETPGAEHGNSGYNHGWAGGPVILLGQYAAGMEPDPDDAGLYNISPRWRGLKSLSATMETRHGLLRSRIEDHGADWSLELDVPTGANARVDLPPWVQRHSSDVSVNGAPQRGPILLGEGKHRVEARARR
ncbi:MAG: hypothetical protein SFV32_06025 [Opitutaceae bacterium]|nr:hypothetical protein [Opitutaceae bacterium]